jgi:D-sedoheptulose 7-phosphate isomerase
MDTEKKISEIITLSLNETAGMVQHIEKSCGKAIIDSIHRIVSAFERGNKVLICGNGGSAADSQHMAAEFVVRFRKNRSGLPAIALTTDTSILTACSNDYGFQTMFSRQVEALGRKGDIFIGLSTSGTSENIILAMRQAKSQGLTCIAFTGSSKNVLGELADIHIQIPCKDTAKAQEGHIIIIHLICEMVERLIFP